LREEGTCNCLDSVEVVGSIGGPGELIGNGLDNRE